MTNRLSNFSRLLYPSVDYCRSEFDYMFRERLKILTKEEVSLLMAIMDRDDNGSISWEEFLGLFELIWDPAGWEMLKVSSFVFSAVTWYSTTTTTTTTTNFTVPFQDFCSNIYVAKTRIITNFGNAIPSTKADIREQVKLALMKLQKGVMPNPEHHLAAFLGMPSTYRRSILQPLDNIKEFSLHFRLLPTLDSRGSIKLTDMEVRWNRNLFSKRRLLENCEIKMDLRITGKERASLPRILKVIGSR
jgi:hypothetical protein